MFWLADFETTSHLENETRVWLWAIKNLDLTEIHIGYNIKSFFDFIKENCINDTIYFHNLKFDGIFIIDFLFRSEFEYSKEFKENSFNCMITDTQIWYNIQINLRKEKRKQQKITIQDSLKLIPYSEKTICQAFKLETKKGEIDYKKPRGDTYIPTQEEIDYIKNDIMIIDNVMKTFKSEGYNKMTIGACALSYFKENFGKKNWERHFPILDKEIDDFIRKSYKGGWTYLNPKYKGKDVNNGLVYDVNSMYPAVMYEFPYPVGIPQKFTGEYILDESMPLYVIELICTFKLKKGKLPSIQSKNTFRTPQYMDEVTEPLQLTLTSIDLELLHENYHVTIFEYVGGYKFSKATGIFTDYIDYFIKMKIDNNGKNICLRNIAKLFLNSLYGKFGTNPYKVNKIPYLDVEKNCIEFNNTEEEYTKPVFTAIASFITSYARRNIIQTANKIGKRFIYADTDSVHIEGLEIPDINIDDNKLGYYKLEYKFTKARYIKGKTYIEQEENGTLHKTIAGCPDRTKEIIDFTNFNTMFSLTEENGIEYYNKYGKLVPKRVKGGVILKPTEFTIKEDITKQKSNKLNK